MNKKFLYRFVNSANSVGAKLLISAFLVFSMACTKTEGEGGLATIKGRVLVKEYNATFTLLEDTYYAQDEDVFILYGDEQSIGDRVKTSYDGWFEFNYLRPGNYQVYCYSKDSSLQTMAKIPIVRDVLITGRKEVVEVDEMIIFN